MSTKHCKDCDTTYPLTLEFFGANGKTPSGKKKWKARCHACTSAWHDLRYKERLTAAVGGTQFLCCWNCNYNRLFAALDFHHLDPSQKDRNVGAMHNYSASRITAEVQKCVILCRVCHVEAHHGLIDINRLRYGPLRL